MKDSSPGEPGAINSGRATWVELDSASTSTTSPGSKATLNESKRGRRRTRESRAEANLDSGQISMGRRVREFFISGLIFFLFKVLRATWRLDESEMPPEIRARIENGGAVVFAHWHEDEWALLGHYAGRGMTVLVSLSRDGSLMASFLTRLGFGVARGSSSRNAVGGFLSLKRVVEKSAERKVSLAVDGPRGPRHRVKRGVFKLAEVLDSPVLAGAAAADRAWVFRRSWSKAFVPMPFARVKLVYASPLLASEIQKSAERDDYSQLEWELEERLRRAKVEAKRLCGLES